MAEMSLTEHARDHRLDPIVQWATVDTIVQGIQRTRQAFDASHDFDERMAILDALYPIVEAVLKLQTYARDVAAQMTKEPFDASKAIRLYRSTQGGGR